MAITFTYGLEPLSVKEPPYFRSANESERRSIVALQGINGYTNPLETDVTFPRGVYECNITNGGSGYVTPPIITITNLGSSAGSGATATTTVEAISPGGSPPTDGSVIGLTMTNNGTGYTAIPTVAITGSDTDILFTFTNDDVSVSANTITKTAHGMSDGDRIHLTTTNRLPLGLYETDTIGNIIPNPDYYIVNKTDNTFQLSKTSGGTVVDIKDVGQPTATAVLGGERVAGIWLSIGGGPYITSPTVVITGDGTGAAAAAELIDGRVLKVNMTNYGSGYSTIPIISFTGGMGTHTVRKGGGATATAVIGQGATAKVVTSTTGVITDITMLTSGGGTGATASPSNIGDSVGTISGLSGGSGFTSPTVSFSGGGGSGATATATETGGVIDSVTLTAGGSGYTSAPSISFSGGGGSGASATAGLTVHPYITSIDLTAGGSNYVTVPTVVFDNEGTGGSGASATAVVSGGAITGVSIVTAGSSYASTPTISFFGGGHYINTSVQISSGADGSGATATCELEANAVKTSTVTAGGTNYASLISLVDKAIAVSTDPISIDKAIAVAESAIIAGWITNLGGSGYTSQPTVVFAPPPSGTTATGTANISGGAVTSITIISGGSGYSSAPSISYTGGGGSGAGGNVIITGNAVTSVKMNNLPEAWESAGYTVGDATSVKTVVDGYITKCTEAENAIASLLAQISTVTTGNFLEHNHMLCGLLAARSLPSYKPAYHEIMGLINTAERLKDYLGVPFENHTLKLFSSLWIGDDVIDTAMVHLNINPLSAGTYDLLDITARMFAASDNATTLIALIAIVQAPLDIWVANISGDVGAFNTLRTNDEAEFATTQAWQDYVMEGLKNNGYWTQDYTKLGWTDVVGSVAANEIITDLTNETIK